MTNLPSALPQFGSSDLGPQAAEADHRFVEEIRRAEPVQLAVAYGVAQKMALALQYGSGTPENGELVDAVTSFERKVYRAVDQSASDRMRSSRQTTSIAFAGVVLVAVAGMGGLFVSTSSGATQAAWLVTLFAVGVLTGTKLVRLLRRQTAADRNMGALLAAAGACRDLSGASLRTGIVYALKLNDDRPVPCHPEAQMQLIGEQLFARSQAADGSEVARAAQRVQRRHPESPVTAAELSVAVLEAEMAKGLLSGFTSQLSENLFGLANADESASAGPAKLRQRTRAHARNRFGAAPAGKKPKKTWDIDAESLTDVPDAN